MQYTGKVVLHQNQQTYQYLACHHVNTQRCHRYHPLLQGNATPRNSLHIHNMATVNGVGTNSGVGVEEARPKGRERGIGSWGGNSQPLPTK